ncbi:MAG TPA: DAK2 domain-containing protein [Acidimicrobiales bacterium]|nr:DAK2 domain-containing protein [Acidimicrobiales bacterium]
MGELQRLGAEHLKAVVVGYRDALRAHQEALNRLNVYPVPDGDTGTNMALTLESVVAELDGTADMAGVCGAIGRGSLMGARGNSGVILSQLLRGLTSRLAECDGVDAATLAEALAEASRASYQAVMEPVEGTILTVAREAAEAAASRADGELVDVLEAAAAAARASLERTPELLPVLREAGVVDAGAAGFVLLLDVLLHVTAGRPVPEPDPAAARRPVPEVSTTAGHHAAPGGPRYEVMYLLDAPDEAVGALKEAWAGIGDSIVVVGGDGTWNCHVHTDDIGAAVEAGVVAGRPYRIRVTDLYEQVEAEQCLRDHGDGTGGSTETAEAEAPVATAVVAVGAGEGIARMLRSLGAQRVVAGGQSMNPSTAEILAAVESAPGKEVVVLPNNKNVVAVAEQAAAAASRPVRVVPTKAVPQAFAALLAYDADADAETNARAMAEAVTGVVTGEVTHAVRDATTPAGPVRAGDWVGVAADAIVAVAKNPADAACSLLEQLVGESHEIVTVVAGEPASPEDTDRVTDWLARNRPGVEVEVHDGGQPLAAWLFSVE